MTAMQIMERCRRAGADRRALEGRIQRYRDSASRITSALDGIGARGTGESDRMAALMAEIDELERQIAQRDREYAAEISAACRLIDSLTDLEAQVMSRYYVRGETLSGISQAMGYSYGYVRGLKSLASKRLEETPDATIAAILPEWYRDEKRQR